MESLRVECKIVTPIFMGNASPFNAELRTSAIKGALRFWWRALNGSSNFKELKVREAHIFGSSEEGIGKSKLKLALESNLSSNIPSFKGLGRMVPVEGKSFPINILDYLAYGCHEYVRGEGVKYTKACFPIGGSFYLNLGFLDPEHREAILDAFCALCYFGGIGARSRNGFGKVWNESLIERIPRVKERIKIGKLAPFSAGSSSTVVFQTANAFDNWNEALNEIGTIYRNIRISFEQRHYFDHRVMISQPIIDRRREVDEMFLSRHAKSIFLSVIPEGKRYLGQILVMPYKYLSKSAKAAEIHPSVTQNLGDYQRRYKSVHDDFIKKLDKVLISK